MSSLFEAFGKQATVTVTKFKYYEGVIDLWKGTSSLETAEVDPAFRKVHWVL